MSAFFRHVSARATALARDPAAVLYLLVAAASSLLIFPIMVMEFPAPGEGRFMMQLLGIVLWPWLLSLAALVRVERSDARPFPTEWPLPALPVGPRTRPDISRRLRAHRAPFLPEARRRPRGGGCGDLRQQSDRRLVDAETTHRHRCR